MSFQIPVFIILAFSAAYSIEGHLVTRAGRNAQTSRHLVYARSTPTLVMGKGSSGIVARSTQYSPHTETQRQTLPDGTDFMSWINSWLSPSRNAFSRVQSNLDQYIHKTPVSQQTQQEASQPYISRGTQKEAPQPYISPATSSRPASNLPTYHGGSITKAPPSGSDSERWLTAHNKVRSQYGARPLAWNASLASFAQGCSNKCVWQHTVDNDFGENIAAGQTTIEQVVDNWVYGPQERDEYSPSNPTDTHFTQVVWDSSRSLGCAQRTCNQVEGSGLPQPNPVFWACEYYPPGNVVGEYDQNVNAQQGGKPDV